MCSHHSERNIQPSKFVLSAILGDMIGSPYECTNIKGRNLPLWSQLSRYTDDTILIIATAEAMLHGYGFAEHLREWCEKYPDAGYGGGISQWLRDPEFIDFDADGNSAAVRGLAVGAFAKNEKEAMSLAELAVSYSHPSADSIKYAKATSLAAFYLKSGQDKASVIKLIESFLGISLSFDVEELNRTYDFSTQCCKTVPIALYVALTTSDYSEAMRTCLYIGGDTDTIMAICGGLISLSGDAKIPEDLLSNCKRQLSINAPDIANFVLNLG